MVLVLASILAIYLIAMAWVYLGMARLPYFTRRKATQIIPFSIVVPFRNEAQNLPRLLQSIKELRYDRFSFEILFVDDASEDESVAIIQSFLEDSNIQYHIFNNERFSQSPKKDALTLAIKKAKYKWIANLDADCEIPPRWLQLINSHILHKNSKMVCGPVLFATDDSVLKQFQFWDGLSLQAATQGGFGWNTPLLCNGANIAFERDVFFEVKGFEGNNHLATGDDIFLMEKINRYYPGQVHYLKNADATVITQPTNSLRGLLRQRIRWASKTSKNKNLGAKVLGGIVFLGNIGFVIGLAMCFIQPMQASAFAPLLLIKILVDTALLSATACFFKRPRISTGLLSSNFTYPFVVIWVFLNSWRGHYEWKGRSFRK